MGYLEEVKKARIGILIGAIIGFVIGKFLIATPDLQSLFSAQSIFDSITGNTSLTAKSAWFFAFIGAALGFLIDTQFPRIKRLFQ